jgi:hypothetical protein
MTLAPETVAELMCDAVVEPLFESKGRTVGTGPKKRFPPGWMRRRVMQRDMMCRFPGCTRMRLVHAHHITHWPHGPTEPENLLMLCRYHHRKMHQGGWSIRGDPEGAVEFIKPNGEALTSELPRVTPELRRRVLGPILPDG